MGNTQSRILGSFRFVACSLCAFIVCLFGVPRSRVLLLQVDAQALVPPITVNVTSTDIGTSGSFYYLRSAKLDASGTKVLLQDTLNGPILCDAAPYVFLRRATGFGSVVCSFDGTEVSSENTARVYCRKNPADAVFYVFKFSDLSIVQGGAGGTQNPLIASNGTTIADAGMFEFVPGSNYLFIASGLHDGTLYRVDTSTFTYSGTVSSTVTAQDPGNTLEHYVWGACDSGAYCYVLSGRFNVARFSQGTSSVETAHRSTIDLSARDKMNRAPGTSGVNNGRTSVVIDSCSNNLFLASTSGGMVVAKIALSTFTFSTRVVLRGPNRYLILCHNCFTAGNEYLMVLQYSAQKTTFIRVSDMTELTDPSASASAAPHYPVTAWISQRSNTGGIVAEGHGRLAAKMMSLAIRSGIGTPAPPCPALSSPPPSPPPPSPPPPSPPPPVTLIAVFSVIGVLLLIAGLAYLIYRRNCCFHVKNACGSLADQLKNLMSKCECRSLVDKLKNLMSKCECGSLVDKLKNLMSKCECGSLVDKLKNLMSKCECGSLVDKLKNLMSKCECGNLVDKFKNLMSKCGILMNCGEEEDKKPGAGEPISAEEAAAREERVRRMAHDMDRIDNIVENEEPCGRKRCLQENIDSARSLCQLAELEASSAAKKRAETADDADEELNEVPREPHNFRKNAFINQKAAAAYFGAAASRRDHEFRIAHNMVENIVENEELSVRKRIGLHENIDGARSCRQLAEQQSSAATKKAETDDEAADAKKKAEEKRNSEKEAAHWSQKYYDKITGLFFPNSKASQEAIAKKKSSCFICNHIYSYTDQPPSDTEIAAMIDKLTVEKNNVVKGKLNNDNLIGQESSAKVFRCSVEKSKWPASRNDKALPRCAEHSPEHIAFKVFHHVDDTAIKAELKTSLQGAAGCPHIVAPIGYWENEDGEPKAAILLPRAEKSLAQIRPLNRVRATLADVADTLGGLLSVCKAVQHLHNKRDILHQDIKPQNILVLCPPPPTNRDDDNKDNNRQQKAMQYKLADLGASKSNCAVGTLKYMSPELLLLVGQSATKASDIYALGLTLFDSLSEECAIPEKFLDNESVFHTAHTEEKIQIDPLKLPDCTNKYSSFSGLATTIGRCFKKDPSKRPSADELVAALSAAKADCDM